MKPLTEYLAKYFRDEPLILVDIGARGGIDPSWLPLGDSIRAYCVEADIEECETLNRQNTPNIIYIPAIIAGSKGEATLYETRLNESAGLYQTNQKFFGRLLNSANATLVKTHLVDTTTLDEVRETYDIPAPDFIKLDVEGAELDILRSSFLGGTFGFYSEFRFHKEINGCPTFSDLDQFAKSKGFMLYDLIYTRQSRKALPYRGPIMQWASGERFHAYTTRGQVMDGDALYFRDPLLYKMTRTQILKAACMFEISSLNDCAAELLIEREKEAEIDIQHCLDLLAGGSFRTYMENY
jgi:FkbM family methyltransferase